MISFNPSSMFVPFAVIGIAISTMPSNAQVSEVRADASTEAALRVAAAFASSAAPASATLLTAAQVAQYAYNAGFRGSGLVNAVAIAKHESGFETTAQNVNTNGTVDRGLWQINSIHGYSSSCLFDPACCADAAYDIAATYSSDCAGGIFNWCPWVTFWDSRFFAATSSVLAQARTAAAALDSTVVTSSGNRVQVCETSINVRNSAGGASVGSRPQGSMGSVVDGPTVAPLGGCGSGRSYYYIWWKVQWDNGLLGWSVEDFLIKIPDTTVEPPEVDTLAATSITRTGAVLNGIIASDGGAPITGRWFGWGPDDPTDNVTPASSISGSNFSLSLTGLSPDNCYGFVAFASNDPSNNEDRVGFGLVRSFCTPECTTNSHCNDSDPCTNDVCSSGACTNPPAASGTGCGSSNSSGCDSPDTCDGAGHCLNRVKSAGAVCRAAAGECDIDEVCNGFSISCPSNAFRVGGYACGSSSSSSCNAPDSCDGLGDCIDRVKSAGTVCRAAASECDLAEVCNGSSASCPSDVSRPNGFSCGSSNSSGCAARDTCDGSGTCVDRLQPGGTVCRSAVGVCDLAEVCSGVSATCPSDALLPSGSPCDDEEYCTVSDSCWGAVCQGEQRDCNDGVPCSADSCNEAENRCDHIANNSACQDGIFCNGNETCDVGLGCVGGPDPCSAGQCCNEVSNACSPALWGDSDSDCERSLADYGTMMECFAVASDECLHAFDSDGDSDLDLFDFAEWQNLFGTNVP